MESILCEVRGFPPQEVNIVAKSGERTQDLACSFCAKRQREVKKLISGPKVFICDECISLCNEIIGEDEPVSAGIEEDEVKISKDDLPF